MIVLAFQVFAYTLFVVTAVIVVMAVRAIVPKKGK